MCTGVRQSTSKQAFERKGFKGILPYITIIWIQLCHYSRLLSVKEGMLNTPTIRLQNEPFTLIPFPLFPLTPISNTTQEAFVTAGNRVASNGAGGLSFDL